MGRVNADELEETWAGYLETRSLALRNELLVHYTKTLVRPIALRMAKGVPQVSDAGQDFISFGIFGLVDAMERFDAERGARFETFAGPRIRGSILDELRALDWVPRGLRSAGRAVERAEEGLVNELGRQPTAREVEGVVGAKARHSIVKLQLDNDPPEGAVVDHGQDIESNAVVEDVVARAAEAIAHLDDRLKTIAVLVYVEGHTLTQVGRRLGVSESRVCQLQGQFLRELNRAMAS